MFLVLLGIAASEEITLCFKKTADCPGGLTPETTIQLLTANSLTSTNTYKILSDDTADVVVDESNLPFIVAITGYGSAATKFTVSISKALALTKPLTLENAEVEVSGSAASLTATVSDLTLSKDGKFSLGTTTPPTLTITKLTSSSMAQAKDLIASAVNVAITDIDAVCEVAANGDKTTIKNCKDSPDSFEVPKTCKVLDITSYVTVDGKTIKGDATFATVETVITINLEYGNKNIAVLTIDPSAGLLASKDKLIINVNSYYTKLATALAGDAAESIKLNTNYEIETATPKKRKSVPAAEKYCMSQTEAFVDADCTTDSQLLWSTDEMKTLNNVEVYLSGYTAANQIALNLEDYKTKSMEFIGLATQQLMKLTLKDATSAVTGYHQYNNIKISTVLPATATEATIGFQKLFVKKSEIAVAASSMKLKDAPSVKVNSVDLVVDAESIGKFALEKPSNSFTAIEVGTVTFSADGTKVTIGTKELTDKEIPVPFTIQADSLESKATLKIEEAADKKPVKTLQFNFNVPEGTNMEATFEGDWSSNEIIVNVEGKETKFQGKLAEKAVAPTMWKTGSGSAFLGKDEIKPLVVDSPTPTPKGGLSGGAIAGIVIACVVVVAAVVVVVVVVIKKKKGKVAN